MLAAAGFFWQQLRSTQAKQDKKGYSIWGAQQLLFWWQCFCSFSSVVVAGGSWQIVQSLCSSLVQK
jgi:hypothetical protein